MKTNHMKQITMTLTLQIENIGHFSVVHVRGPFYLKIQPDVRQIGCLRSIIVLGLTHSHTVTPFDAPGKQAF